MQTRPSYVTLSDVVVLDFRARPFLYTIFLSVRSSRITGRLRLCVCAALAIFSSRRQDEMFGKAAMFQGRKSFMPDFSAFSSAHQIFSILYTILMSVCNSDLDSGAVISRFSLASTTPSCSSPSNPRDRQASLGRVSPRSTSAV
jgi:hypothetical protein